MKVRCDIQMVVGAIVIMSVCSTLVPLAFAQYDQDNKRPCCHLGLPIQIQRPDPFSPIAELSPIKNQLPVVCEPPEWKCVQSKSPAGVLKCYSMYGERREVAQYNEMAYETYERMDEFGRLYFCSDSDAPAYILLNPQ